MNFKHKDIPLNIRRDQCQKVKKEFPNRAVVICERAPNSSLPEITKTKYLPAYEMTFGQFSFLIRKKLNIDKKSALFFYIEGKKMIIGSETMLEIYEKYKNEEDKILYICYYTELDKGH